MTMEEKNKLVIDYINNIKDNFEKSGNPVSDETVTNVTNRYINSSKSFEEIKQEIDKMVEEKLEEIRKKLEFIEKIQKEAKSIMCCQFLHTPSRDRKISVFNIFDNIACPMFMHPFF